MEKIEQQRLDNTTFIYASSRLLERTSYYGLRALIVIYMLSETLKLPRNEALYIYGMFTTVYLFSQVFGAILGDLLLGNKKALLFGGIIQALGAFSLIIPSINGLYIGLGLIVIGGGLYTPNLISQFGKLHVNKTKLLDSAFTTLYAATNAGGLLGTLVIAFIGERFGWSYGFILAGIGMLTASLILLTPKNLTLGKPKQQKFATLSNSIRIISLLLLTGVFWTIYEITNVSIYTLQVDLVTNSSLGISQNTWIVFPGIFTVFLSILLAVLWTFFYTNQFTKLASGFFFGALAVSIFLLIPKFPSDLSGILFLTTIFFFTLAEIYVVPIIHSALARFSNPKYLAIIISLSFFPIKILSYMLHQEQFNDMPYTLLKYSRWAMLFISVCITTYIITQKTKSKAT